MAHPELYKVEGTYFEFLENGLKIPTVQFITTKVVFWTTVIPLICNYNILHYIFSIHQGCYHCNATITSLYNQRHSINGLQIQGFLFTEPGKGSLYLLRMHFLAFFDTPP